MLTPERVKDAFVSILGRAPTAAETERYRNCKTVRQIRNAQFGTGEFWARYALWTKSVPARKTRDTAIVFQHLPKCAGTSVHDVLLRTCGTNESYCPERFNGLWHWPPAALLNYSVFSGHFDAASIRLVPADRKLVFTVLRSPNDRLLSAYTYLRSYKPDSRVHGNRNVLLAKHAYDLDPEDFFSHPEIRKNPSIDNCMTRCLSGGLPFKDWESHDAQIPALELFDRDPDAALQKAIENLDAMAAFGISEELELCLPHIFSALGLPKPEAVARKNVTRINHLNNPALDPIEKPEVDARLSDLLTGLNRYDQMLYDHAASKLATLGVLAKATA